MASLVHQLTKNAPSLRTVASLGRTHLFPKPLVSPHNYLGPPKPECRQNPPPHSEPASIPNIKASNFLPIFPNSPFGYCLNPIPPTGLDRFGAFQAGEVESDDARKIWADSVKKKRKKKMNKHKLRKLRKSLSRKTKA